MLTKLLDVHHCVVSGTPGVLAGDQSQQACGLRFTLVTRTWLGVQGSKHHLLCCRRHFRQKLCRLVIGSRVDGSRLQTQIVEAIIPRIFLDIRALAYPLASLRVL